MCRIFICRIIGLVNISVDIVFILSIYNSESEDTSSSLASEETMDATELQHLDDLSMEEPDEALNAVDQNDDSSGECIYF